MNTAMRELVWRRSGGRCEYCRFRAEVLSDPMHVEHIIARQHGGADTEDNLALACSHCNRHKGPNVATVDPDGVTPVLLYHPRRDAWEQHFAFEGPLMVGKTQSGRATIFVLAMNAPGVVEIRELLIKLNEWP